MTTPIPAPIPSPRPRRAAASTLAVLVAITTTHGILGAEWRTLPQELGGASNSGDVVLADLDSDGDLDAAVARYVASGTEDGSRIFINQGGGQGGTAGTFMESDQILATGRAGEVGAADLDNDGDPDLVFNGSPGGVQVWWNQGGAQGGTPGRFDPASPRLSEPASSGLALGDLDGDGDIDIWVTVVNAPDRVLVNDGAGRFPARAVPGTDASYAVALGDLDADGDLDAVTATAAGGSVWINQGAAQGGNAGEFVRNTDALGAWAARGLALADVDADGDLDIHLATDQGDGVWLNDGRTPVGFTQGIGGLLTGEVLSIAAADLDGDGDPDAVVGQSSGFTTLIRRNDTGQLEARPATGSGWTAGMGLGDLDGDSLPDLFLARYGQPDEVWINAHVPLPFAIHDLPASVAYSEPGILPFSRATVTSEPGVGWTGGGIDVEVLGESVTGEFLGGSETNRLRIPLPDGATSADVQELLRSIGYSRVLNGMVNLPPRRLRILLTDAGGRSAERAIDVRFPGQEVVAIRLEPEYALLTYKRDCDECRCREFELVREMADGTVRKGWAGVDTNTVTVAVGDGSEFSWKWGAGNSGPVLEVCGIDFSWEGVTSPLVVRWGGHSARATVSKVDGNLESCFLVVLSRLLFAQAEAEPGPAADRRPGRIAAGSPKGPFSLATFRAFETHLGRSDAGRRLAGLYWSHSAEVIGIVARNPDLLVDFLTIATGSQSGVAALLAGQGSEVVFSPDVVTRLDSVWDRLIELGSAPLAEALRAERERLGGIGRFAGMGFDAWAESLSLPPIESPFLAASRARMVDGRFEVEVNRVDGIAYSLWRADRPDADAWAPIPSTEIGTPDAFTILLTDPDPPEGPAFYQVRGVSEGN